MTDATGSFPCTRVFAAPHALTRELRIYFIFLFLILVFSIRYSFAAEVLLTPLEDRVRVTIDDKHFTDYIFRGHLKPILFPILGPGQVPMTRSWPIIDGIAEEPHDHPHHESLWFTHGKVNGIDFWAHQQGAHGEPAPKTLQTKIAQIHNGPEGMLEVENNWVASDGVVVCSDQRTIRFGIDGDARFIDFSIVLMAHHNPVIFGDTKEGTMAMRVHPSLQLTESNGSKGAAGHATNSEGLIDKDIWGKRAAWVDYSGPIDGKTMGIAIFDAPSNLRHPTTWHARDYGLVTANPFGLHDFENAPEEAGNYTIPKGETLQLAYRFLFHSGTTKDATIAASYAAWAARLNAKRVE